MMSPPNMSLVLYPQQQKINPSATFCKLYLGYYVIVLLLLLHKPFSMLNSETLAREEKWIKCLDKNRIQSL